MLRGVCEAIELLHTPKHHECGPQSATSLLLDI
jgi:hypothetical protein